MQDRKDNLRKAVNALMKDYQWQAVAPDNGELATEVEDFPWDSQWPLKYKYKKTTDAPFKGSCIEQALYIKDHFPDSQFLYMKWPERGVNVLHVEPVLKDGSTYRTVHLNPRKDNYLSRRNYKKLENFIKGRISTQHDKAKPLDVYLLDDIPKSGTSKSLLDYAEKNGHKFRYRDGKLLDLVRDLTKEGSAEVYDLPEIQRLKKELSTLDYDWDDPYKTQTIKDILKSRKDHCWGVSRLIRNRLRRAKLDPEVVYMKEEERDGVTPTHQFNTYKDGDDYRVLDYRVDNHSMIPFYGPRGKTREEAILKYLDAWRKEQNSFTGNVDIWTGNYIPKPGKDWYEYMTAIEKGNKLLKKYPALEKQSALLKIAKLLIK